MTESTSPRAALSSKSERHQQLMSKASRALIETPTDQFMNTTVQRVAELLCALLHAECVGVFFRRRVNQQLKRCAFAVNVGGVGELSADFSFDESYSRNSDTLLNQTARGNGETINYGPQQLAGSDVPQAIVNSFRERLGSGEFQHLIIIGLYIGKKHLGAIRVINHLMPGPELRISETSFSSQDESIVFSIGAMLALAYANYRKHEKLIALERFTSGLADAERENETVRDCLKNLTSEHTGFPLALWRSYGARGTVATIQEPMQIDSEDEDAIEIPDAKSLDDAEWDHEAWAQKRKLEVHVVNVDGLDAKRELLVFSSQPSEMDELSKTLIRVNCQFLQTLLGQLWARTPALDIVTVSQSMRDVMKTVAEVARGNSPILLRGESGTGKEEFAREIHMKSPRRSKPFKALNCAGLDQLLEDELFGHVKGGFTGAFEDRKGVFELGDGGTIFLDEIAEMPPSTQAKLLRVLNDPQKMEICPVGSMTTRKVNVRLIAASNQDLAQRVTEGKFRADLYWRLDGHHIYLPPLRERRDEINELVKKFLKKRNDAHPGKRTSSIDPVARAALHRYSWPGNVRELRYAIETAADLAVEGRITLACLPEKIRRASGGDMPNDPSAEIQTLNEHSREYLWAVLVACKLDVEDAAARLGIKLRQLREHITKYHVPMDGTTPATVAIDKNAITKWEEFRRSYVQEIVRKLHGDEKLAGVKLGLGSKQLGRYIDPPPQ